MHCGPLDGDITPAGAVFGRGYQASWALSAAFTTSSDVPEPHKNLDTYTEGEVRTLLTSIADGRVLRMPWEAL